ncbi:tRNA lysidine(34) synthetase TilS [Aestuariibacter sp. A3R04]|uniref:tRNA lysidine(34) synthetase TilS n=1 Tax=Aestuariibacter sp. A3R04 TaxID=2841571 RepID=UPI001C0818C4|nr:tRNA lysidine(34) synthetase TilS [Aestuariibacter sp. A3R04]MBU3022135.1 tRNA lysidine(34) synthetase TilS [Aestuariibacter sp. A3R04]
MSEYDPSGLMSQIAVTLSGQLSALETPPSCLVVGFSGGVDSSLLLHSVSRHPSIPVHAVYIHHGLSQHADDWQDHCKRFCKVRNIPFTAIEVSVEIRPRVSLEAAAREARYNALLDYCKQHSGVLLLGQHQDDQLETILLALKRGSGPAGLAGMPERVVKRGVTVLRPLLNLSREAIERAAKALSLTWIHDESNDDNRFDRNFLRNAILPGLSKRWPEFSAAAGRSSQLLVEQNTLMDEVVGERLAGITSEQGYLNTEALKSYSVPWQRALCRGWLKRKGLTLPSYTQLNEMLRILDTKDDAQPVVRTGNYEVRYYRGSLRVCYPLPQAEPTRVKANVWTEVTWWPGRFCISLSAHLKEDALCLKPVVESDKIQPENQRAPRSTRKYLKDWGVPAWERNNVPVLCYEHRPLVIMLRESVIWLERTEGINVVLYNGNPLPP